MSLTNLKVEKAKPQERPYKLYDGNGLSLHISPAGGKAWRYKYKFSNKEKSLTIGRYPVISLKNARSLRDEAYMLVAAGIDPAQKKKDRKEELDKQQVEGKTFKQVAVAWTDFKALPNTKRSWKPTHKIDVLKSLEREVFPAIGGMLIKNISIDDIENILEPIKNRGALEVLDRVLGRIEATFRYGKVKRWCTQNPAEGLKEIQPTRKTKHMAFLKKKELSNFLTDLDGYQGNFVCKSAVSFVLLTHVRTDELRFSEWKEIDFNKCLWEIPAHRMKMKISQTVPLSKQAIQLLKSLQPITGSSQYIFASLIRMKQPISENGMLSVIYRMGYKGKTTIHGLRATFSTIGNEELKLRPDTIESALAHKVVDPVRGAYNHATYLEERAENIQKWADFLDKQRVGESNIVLLRANKQ